MLSALYLSREHRITLELYSEALLQAVEIVLGDGISRIEMENVLAERGLIASSSSRSAAGTKVQNIAGLTIYPDTFDPARFLVDLRAYDAELLRIARTTSTSDRLKQERIPLLFHEPTYPFSLRVNSIRIAEVISDPIETQRGFYVRVEYEYLTPPQNDQADFVSDPSVIPAIFQERITAYAGYLFDGNGRLILSHADRPIAPPSRFTQTEFEVVSIDSMNRTKISSYVSAIVVVRENLRKEAE